MEKECGLKLKEAQDKETEEERHYKTGRKRRWRRTEV